MKCFVFPAWLLLFSGYALQDLPPATERIVIVVSMDGLAHCYFDDPKGEMPNIRHLASEGGPRVLEPCGSHGYDPNEPMLNATFVASGVGFKQGCC